MTYREVTQEQARKCCKRHSKKCAKCPLRREHEWTDEKGIKHSILQFCTFVLLTLYSDDQDQERQMLLEEELHHEDEWRKFIDSLESQE